MKLEASLKHFSPQGMHISDSVHGTSPDRLTGTDIVYALGATSNRARFGLAAYLGKAGVSKTDEQQAMQALARHAIETAPKNVRKAAGAQLGRCMLVLAQFAFAEYSRSAASTHQCPECCGSGVTKDWEDVVVYAGLYKSDGEEILPPTVRREIVIRQCPTCGGKGKLSARCRCGGSGEVLDRKKTEELGVPTFKRCERCNGEGFTSLPSTAAYRAVLRYLPELNVRTWTRNWKPFCDVLVDKCWREEARADIEFQKATQFNHDGNNI